MKITCPYCCLIDTVESFDMSLCGECFCPQCGCEFLIDNEEEGADDE